jgi:hypothetical protein
MDSYEVGGQIFMGGRKIQEDICKCLLMFSRYSFYFGCCCFWVKPQLIITCFVVTTIFTTSTILCLLLGMISDICII